MDSVVLMVISLSLPSAKAEGDRNKKHYITQNKHITTQHLFPLTTPK